MLAIVAIIIIINIIFPKLRWAREFVWGGVADTSGLAEERWGKWREPGVIWLCKKQSLYSKCSSGRPEVSRKGWHVPSHVLEPQIGL